MILYSTGCPQCSVLKHKLEQKQIEFIINSSVEDMLAKGLKTAPALELEDGTVLKFPEAIQYLKTLEDK